MESEQRFDTGLVGINYARFDAKPGAAPGYPLVLLHGGSSRWQAALPIIPALTQFGPVYALDLRGHGSSGRVPGRYTLRDYASDVVAFLEGVMGERAVLFGHSMGGQVAIIVAAERPGLVAA